MGEGWHTGLRVLTAAHHRRLRDESGISVPVGSRIDTEVERLERFLAVLDFEFKRAYDQRVALEELGEFHRPPSQQKASSARRSQTSSTANTQDESHSARPMSSQSAQSAAVTTLE